MQSVRSAASWPRCTCTCARTRARSSLRPPSSFRRSFASSSRSLAPPFVYTTLPSRALLAVRGPDAPAFLQGLVSNDVRRLAPRGSEDDPDKQRILYANILKADVSHEAQAGGGRGFPTLRRDWLTLRPRRAATCTTSCCTAPSRATTTPPPRT